MSLRSDVLCNGKEKEYAVNLISRRWNSVKDAWKREGIRGVYDLVNCRLHYRKDIREMAARRAAADLQYDTWFREQLPGSDEQHLQHERKFSHTLSFLIPTYNTRPDLLRALADSLLSQTCDAWEACMYDGASSNQETISMLKQIADEDERFHVVFGRENLGISENTNKALFLASGDYVALCDHDDLLSPDCVYWILDAAEKGADFIYSDEDKTNEDGSRFFDAHMKADFSPDALRSGNYICHIMAMSSSLIRSVNGLRSSCDGSQDHDLALRATEKAKAIAHIPRVLYHWRMLNTSFSHSSAERCAKSAVRAVNDQMERLQLHGRAEMIELRPYITYDIPIPVSISLIVHSLEGGFHVRWGKVLLEKAIAGKERLCEVIVVGDTPSIDNIKNIPVRSASDLEEAAKTAQGNYLLFLEQGTRFLNSQWIERLTMYATRPWIACCGGGIVNNRHDYLVYGYAVDVPDCAIGRMQGDNRHGATYQLYDRSVRECTAVSQSCLMIKKEVFEKLGGFTPYKSDLGAVALGLRAIAHGFSNVLIPEAVCMAPKCSILFDAFPSIDQKQFRDEFPQPTEHYYSPNFEKYKGTMTVDPNVHTAPVTVIARFGQKADA